MKYLRFAVLFTVLACVLAIVPAAFAQDETFGLGADDYALFTAANENTAASTSFAYDFVADLALTGIEDTELSANVNGSGEISDNDGEILFSLTTTGTAVSNGDETATDIEIRVIGDTLYINTGDGWQGGLLSDVVGAAAGGAGLPVDPDDLMSGDMSGMGDMGGMMSGLATLDPSEYVSIERLDDADGWAHFSTSLDIAGLLSSDELSGIVGTAMGGAMGGGSEMTPEQAVQMGQMMGMLFADAVFTLDQYVNVETEMVENAVLTIELPLENLVGAPGAALSVSFDITLSNFDEAVSIEVPEDVTMMESGS